MAESEDRAGGSVDSAVDLPRDMVRSIRTKGLRSLFRSGLTLYQRLQAFRISLVPIDFWRYAEFSHVIGALPLDEGPILDIASPKALGAYLAGTGRHVISSDVHPRHGEEMAIYLGGALGSFRGIGGSAVALPFESDCFPFVYSVSVIEHIGGEGDRAALAEIARVLRPGGYGAITVPIASEYEEVWHPFDTFGAQPVDSERGVFFCHVYDRAALNERLCRAVGLELVEARGVFARDARWLAKYQEATAAPRSVRAIRTKLMDGRWARRSLVSIELEQRWPEGRGVALLTFRKQ